MVAIVSVYDEGIIRAIQGDGGHWNRQTAWEVLNLAQQLCPSGSTGVLRASHGVEQNRTRGAFATGFHVYNNARHALWVHNGTGIYGPRHTPIVPMYTPERKYLHVPPGMGWQWTLTTKLAAPRKRQKGVRGPYVRIYDPSDPYGHAEQVDGQEAYPWLRWAGEDVARSHGAR